MAFVFDLEDDLSIPKLVTLVNEKGPDYDKFLAIPQAVAWSGVSAQTLEKLIVSGFYTTKDGVQHPLKCRPKDKNVKAGISARSLIEWYNADRRTAGFGAKKSRTTTNFVVAIPNELIAEFKDYCTGHSIKCQTSVERAQEVKARKEAKAAAKAQETPTA